jgi:DNA replication protein DnaC
VTSPLQNQDTCPLCNGTGWKTFQDGEIERVTRCDCWKENINRRLVADARIPRRYHHCTLNDFVTYDNETLEEALGRARRLAAEFPVVSRGLFLLGDPGVGKTHLAVAILKQVILTRGARGIFYDTRDLLKLIRGPNNGVKTTELDVLKPVWKPTCWCWTISAPRRPRSGSKRR